MPASALSDPLSRLAVLDPQLAARVTERLAAGPPPTAPSLSRLVEETCWATSVAIPLGTAVAAGGADVLAHAGAGAADRYWQEVRAAAAHGPERAQLLAEHLVPVICRGGLRLLDRLKATLSVLLEKGSYTLNRPLKTLAALLGEPGHGPAATAYLDLLDTAFGRPLTYNQSLHLTHVLPKAARSLAAGRRAFQIEQLRRVTAVDVSLTDDFVEGLSGGLDALDAQALADFVTEALSFWPQRVRFGRRMLALRTADGRDRCRALQRVVRLVEVQPALLRYTAARLGQAPAVRCLDDLPEALRRDLPAETAVCGDGEAIYLPFEVGAEATRAANADRYKLLVRLETGHFEMGTFDFDLGRLTGRMPADDEPGEDRCDLERFFARFSCPGLAEDLFTVAEHGRLRFAWARWTPGLWRDVRPVLRAAIPDSVSGRLLPVLVWLYRRIVLDEGAPGPPSLPAAVADLPDRFAAAIRSDSPVEAAAAWVSAAYPPLADLAGDAPPPGRLPVPFGWRVYPSLFGAAHRDSLRRASRLQRRLREMGAAVYRGALVRQLIRNRGRLGKEDLAAVLADPRNRPPDAPAVGLTAEALKRLLGSAGRDVAPRTGPAGPVWWYPEWDQAAAGYLADHVRVAERPVAAGRPDFYRRTLERRHGLLTRMRRAFELLRPEGLGLLRQWIEGDEFDYRALVDYAVDRRAGASPSERLYIKRVKRRRDVTVLLLVDLSRSTANRVSDGSQSVLEVEKEALVLFCEALQVVGDRFALAGFSGTGRLGVDYFAIKAFDEPITDVLRGRIDALRPQRATRMGGAIRHAIRCLAAEPARVRLLIVLGDGFPNDLDYKGDHAVADTRQAIGEARAAGIHTHAITVNLPFDARLDDLYGQARHTLIADVRELPDKLLAVYGRLTR